jgi:hypothetical protein
VVNTTRHLGTRLPSHTPSVATPANSSPPLRV